MAESMPERAARIAGRAQTTSTRLRRNIDPRGKQVRITTDLPQETYQALTGFCHQAAAEAGVARVPHTAVVRALIGRLTTDAKLAAQITADLGS